MQYLPISTKTMNHTPYLVLIKYWPKIIKSFAYMKDNRQVMFLGDFKLETENLLLIFFIRMHIEIILATLSNRHRFRFSNQLCEFIQTFYVSYISIGFMWMNTYTSQCFITVLNKI